MWNRLKDKDLAIEYYSEENTKPLYKIDSNENTKIANWIGENRENIISTIDKNIRDFRTQLMWMIRPINDTINVYEITKSQNQLYEILYENILYKYGCDENTRHFAKFFYEKLIKNSRAIVSEKLFSENSVKIVVSEDLLHNKNKRNKRAKKKNRNKNNQKDNHTQNSNLGIFK